MNVVEVNRYPPPLFRNGRYLMETWTAVSDVGREYGGQLLTMEEYLATESRYVRAIHELMRSSNVDVLHPHNVERWEGRDERALTGDTLDEVIRHCLREDAWLELVLAPRFLVHFGYDLRVIIASDADLRGAVRATEELGLFVYEGNARLPTLDRWAGISSESE